jgi:hypothetical protein
LGEIAAIIFILILMNAEFLGINSKFLFTKTLSLAYELIFRKKIMDKESYNHKFVNIPFFAISFQTLMKHEFAREIFGNSPNLP